MGFEPAYKVTEKNLGKTEDTIHKSTIPSGENQLYPCPHYNFSQFQVYDYSPTNANIAKQAAPEIYRKPVAEMSQMEKFEKAIEFAPLEDEVLQHIGELTSPATIEKMIVGISFLIGVECTPLGWCADLIGLGYAIYQSEDTVETAEDLAYGFQKLIAFSKHTSSATTYKQLHEAGSEFAEGISSIGFTIFEQILDNKIEEKTKSSLESNTLHKPVFDF